MIAVLSLIDLAAIGLICLVVLVALRVTGKRLELRIGSVQASVDTAANAATKAAETGEQVNKAVNCRPAGDPTLYEEVRAVRLHLDDLSIATQRTAAKTEEIGERLTAHLAHHQAETDRT